MTLKVSIMLADTAQVAGGKLYILGGGWSRILVGFPFAVAVKVEVPWNQATDSHQLLVELVDADGNPVLVGDGDDTKPVVFEHTFSTGIPPNVRPGTPLDLVFTASVGPGLPLTPGARYQWALSIDGKSRDDWHVAFEVLAMPPEAVAA